MAMQAGPAPARTPGRPAPGRGGRPSQRGRRRRCGHRGAGAGRVQRADAKPECIRLGLAPAVDGRAAATAENPLLAGRRLEGGQRALPGEQVEVRGTDRGDRGEGRPLGLAAHRAMTAQGDRLEPGADLRSEHRRTGRLLEGGSSKWSKDATRAAQGINRLARRTHALQPSRQTGLYVSELCLGAMTFGGKGFWQSDRPARPKRGGDARRHRARRRRQLHRHRRRVLGGRERDARRRRARSRSARPREQVVVATKVRGRVGPGVNQVGLSRAPHPREHRRAACGGWASTTSTSIRSTASIRRRRSKRRCARSTTSCAPARRATSASATCRRGWRSKAIDVRRRRTASRASRARRSTTRSPGATSSARSCRCARPRASRSCRGARSPAACCRASSIPTRRARRTRAAPRSTSRR